MLGDVEETKSKAEEHSIGTGHEVLGFDNEKEWGFGGVKREDEKYSSQEAA